MDPVQRRRRQAAIDKATKPTLYEFSTRRVDSQGLRPGTNAQPLQNAQHDLRGNLVAPDAPRESFAGATITLGTTSRISDIPLTKKEQESIRNGQLPRLIRFGGQRTTKKGPITSAKYKFWSALTDVYEGPLLPAPPSTGDGIGPPSSDLIHAVIKFAATHYASRGQLRARHHNQRTTKSDPTAPRASKDPSVPAAHLAKFLTLDRAFDATAAHAIGMIVQELVRDTVTKSMTPPVPQSHIQGKRKREGPKRYTSPSLTLSKRRVRSSPTSRPPKSTKQRRTVRKTTRKSLRGDQLDETTLSMDEATVLVEDEAEELEDTSENDAQDEMDIEVSQ